MVDKILEAIEEAAYFIEALDHSAENDAMVSKLRSALSQQPESEPEDSVIERIRQWHWEKRGRQLYPEDYRDIFEIVRRHASPQPSAQVPEGWRLMPIDPDLKQLEAGRLAAKFVEVDISLNALAVIYAEMRAAAPPIPEPQP